MTKVKLLKYIESISTTVDKFGLKMILDQTHLSLSNGKVTHIIPRKLNDEDFKAAVHAVLVNLSTEYKRSLNE